MAGIGVGENFCMSKPQVPFISVVIPAYYSISTLPGCLDALRRQTYRSFEVILINSSPELQTETLVRTRYPEVRFKQHQGRLLPHAARNRGVDLAQGDLFVFTDPDCEADPHWLEQMVLAFQDDRQVLVGAMDHSDNCLWEKAIHLIKYHWLLPGVAARSRTCAPTANAAYSRQLWEKIGPFRGDYFSGDGILSYRAAMAGHTPRFVSAAIVRHHHHNSPMVLFYQRFQRGRDFARAQLCDMAPPMPRDWLRLVFSVAALPMVLMRAGRDAFHGGWVAPFLLTLPIQVMGHGLWALGESYGAAEMILRRLFSAGEI